MKKGILFTTVIVAIGALSYSFVRQNNSIGTYEYMTLTQSGRNLKISTVGKMYQDIDIRAERADDLDFRPILKRVQELETEGWETVQNSMSGNADGFANYFLLRKVKD